MNKTKQLLLLSLLLLTGLPLFSETEWSDFTRWSVGVELGGNAFDGDMRIVGSDTRIFNFPSAGAYVEYGINPVLSGGLAYNYHRLHASKPTFSFTSNMHQLYPYLGINFINLFVRQNRSNWGVWGTVGIGLANYTSDKKKNTGTAADPVWTDYALLKHQSALTIPVSLLVEYNITKHVAVNARFQYSGFNRDDVEGGGPEYSDTYSGATNDYLANFALGVRWKFAGRKQHVRNISMSSYLPVCCVEPAVAEAKPDSSLLQRVDSLADRIAELESRPAPEPAAKDDLIEVEGQYVNPAKERDVIIVFERTMYGINFETDRAVIKPESYFILDNMVDLLNEQPHYELTIKGHTDDVGNKDYNLELSKRRANSVKQYMVSHGIAEDRITTEGYGDTQPVANNNTAYGRKRNRRVDFIVLYEEQYQGSVSK